MLRTKLSKQFGFGSTLKSYINTPVNHIKTLLAPHGGNNNMMQNSTVQFGDVAQEWQATFVENTYELSIYQSFDAVQQANFGTIDNPHLIFTSDIAFRFVGCTGPPNEDDYEGHELLFMLLREGPLQRCQSCGQVFKLIRLRDEFSPENDYYQSSFFKLDYSELGDADHWVQQSPIRLMPSSFEHSHFEAHSNPIFSLKNNDDHDRILTDPSYRLEQISEAEKATKSFLSSMEYIQKSIIEQHGVPRVGLSRENYENIVLAKIAINKMNRQFNTVQRFHMRQILDPKNHIRREKRMNEKASSRIENGYTVYLNELTEEELKIRDYFESDEEFINSISTPVSTDAINTLNSISLNINNIRFEEQIADNAEPDAISYIKRKIFRFKYRKAISSNDLHLTREKRMLNKLKDSLLIKQAKQIASTFNEQNTSNKILNENKFYELLIDQAIDNYKNYFEDDLEKDFNFLISLPYSEKKLFLTIFESSDILSNSEYYIAGYMTIKKEIDSDIGLIEKSCKLWNDIDKNILPKLSTINNLNLSKVDYDTISKNK